MPNPSLDYWAILPDARKRPSANGNFLADTSNQLFILAESGDDAGLSPDATAIACHLIRDSVVRARQSQLHSPHGENSPGHMPEIMNHAIQQSLQRCQNEPGAINVLGLAFTTDRAHMGHQGDLRGYLQRAGNLYRINLEQTPASPSANDSNSAGQRDSSLGGFPELVSIEFQSEDVFVLCGPEVYEFVSEEQFATIMGSPTAKSISESLIEDAWQNGAGLSSPVVTIRILDRKGQRWPGTTAPTIEELKRCTLFESLGDDTLQAVLNYCRVIEFDQPEMLFAQGEVADAMFLVLDGGVDLQNRGRHIATLQRGEHFGEMALIDDDVRSATAYVQQGSRVLRLSQDDFHAILRGATEVAIPLLWSMLRSTNARLRSTTQSLTTKSQN